MLTKDNITTQDYIDAFRLIGNRLYDLARSSFERSLTLHITPQEHKYIEFPSITGRLQDVQTRHTEPVVGFQDVVSYPLIVAHNHPDGFSEPPVNDFYQLIKMTEDTGIYVLDVRPLSIILVANNHDVNGRILQVAKRISEGADKLMEDLCKAYQLNEEQIAERFYKHLRIAEYQFREAPFKITENDYGIVFNEETNLEDTLKQFEF